MSGRLSDEQRRACLIVAELLADLAKTPELAAYERDLEAEILDHLATVDDWQTASQVATRSLGGIGVRRQRAETALKKLAALGAVQTRRGSRTGSPLTLRYRIAAEGLGQVGTGASLRREDPGVAA